MVRLAGKKGRSEYKVFLEESEDGDGGIFINVSNGDNDFTLGVVQEDADGDLILVLTGGIEGCGDNDCKDCPELGIKVTKGGYIKVEKE